jgi:hypothetical protein
LDVSSQVTIPGKTLVLSPSALADSITGLPDDLTFLMVPSDVQRGPLMVREQPVSPTRVEPVGQVRALEAQIKTERTKDTIKLGIVYRDDALGVGTRDSLSTLTLNGASLASQLASNVRVRPYKPSSIAADTAAIVELFTDFLPDIVVLAGTAEVVSQVMIPLEIALEAKDSALLRPYYVLIDSGRVPELRDATKQPPVPATIPDPESLRKRVRGTGITPGGAQRVFDLFTTDYATAYPDRPGDALNTGVASSYDAAVAIAFAIAANQDKPVTGPNLAAGLRQLAGGTGQFNTGPATLRQAMQALASGERITAMGTFGPLAWDSEGAVLGGTLEVWCVGNDDARTFKSAGLTFDLLTQSASGFVDPATCAW